MYIYAVALSSWDIPQRVQISHTPLLSPLRLRTGLPVACDSFLGVFLSLFFMYLLIFPRVPGPQRREPGVSATANTPRVLSSAKASWPSMFTSRYPLEHLVTTYGEGHGGIMCLHGSCWCCFAVVVVVLTISLPCQCRKETRLYP